MVSIRSDSRPVFVCALLAVLAAVLGVVGLQTGTIHLSTPEVFGALSGSGSSRSVLVVREIRLPRVVTGLGVGTCLGAAGAVFQSISRNPLGSPDVIGFTIGAATGAVVQMVVFNAGPTATAAAAVAGGLLAAAVVYLLSVRGGVTGGYRLVLVGIGVGAMLAAINTILLTKGDSDLAAQANLWLAGSLSARTWGHAATVAAIVVILLPVMLAHGGRLAIIEMGDDAAIALGVRVEQTRLVCTVAAVGVTAVAVAAAGPIAFVALAAPQLASRLTRSANVPIGSGAVMGAVLLTGSDLLSQRLPSVVALPIGLMTGLVGGCYLLWLLTHTKQV